MKLMKSSFQNAPIFYILEFMKPRYDAREFGVLKLGGNSTRDGQILKMIEKNVTNSSSIDLVKIKVD